MPEHVERDARVIKPPAITVEGVELKHYGVSGPVRIALTSYDTAYVACPPTRPVTYGRVEYFVNLDVVRSGTGHWVASAEPERGMGVWKRVGGGAAPAATTRAVEAAVAMAVATTWNDELGQAAAHALAMETLTRIDRARTDKRALIVALHDELETLDDQRTACVAEIRRYAPADVALPEDEAERAVVQVWRHPDPSNEAVRIAYGEDTEPIFEVPAGMAELVEVDDVPNGWIRLVPLPDPSAATRPDRRGAVEDRLTRHG